MYAFTYHDCPDISFKKPGKESIISFIVFKQLRNPENIGWWVTMQNDISDSEGSTPSLNVKVLTTLFYLHKKKEVDFTLTHLILLLKLRQMPYRTRFLSLSVRVNKKDDAS